MLKNQYYNYSLPQNPVKLLPGFFFYKNNSPAFSGFRRDHNLDLCAFWLANIITQITHC